MTEIFHLCMMILVFYGIKNKLKNIDKSSPIQNVFFSRDPKPITIWIIIVICLHFLYDYMNVSLYNAFGLFFFIYGFAFDILLVYYLLNRIKSYPLFPEILKKGENEK
ncbi:MAG: hypothetical protein ACFFAH_15230 [Promethearchaeota archaeon]